MLMNLNTGICNIKSLKQYNQERSILLFLIQRTKYSNASVESYISFLNLFIVLYFCKKQHIPRSIQGSRYTAHMASDFRSVPCYYHSGGKKNNKRKKEKPAEGL